MLRFALAITLALAGSAALPVAEAQTDRRGGFRSHRQAASTHRPSSRGGPRAYGRAWARSSTPPAQRFGRRPRTDARNRPVRVVELSSLRGTEVVSRLRAELRALGFTGDRVIVRYFSELRLEAARTTGTDRDATSTRYDIAVADSSAALRAEHGVRDTHMTYAHELDLSTLAPTIRTPGPFPPHDYLAHLDALEEVGGPSLGGAIAVYDPRTLVRAPSSRGGSSLAEFWFRGDPRESLLLLLHRPPTNPPQRQMRSPL
jgi:hypothetical protein